MRNILQAASAAAALVAVFPAANATVLTFDDLSGTNVFTAPYMGFNFGNNVSATNDFFYSSTFVNSPFNQPFNNTGTAISSSCDAPGVDCNTQRYSMSISSVNKVPFVFNGAFLSGDVSVHYRLLLGGATVFEGADTGTLTTMGKFYASNYLLPVDSVQIFGFQGFYVLDNFTFNQPVPEPATYALMFAGLMGVGAVVRRRRNHSA